MKTYCYFSMILLGFILTQVLTTSAQSCETRKEQFQQFVNTFYQLLPSPPRTCADVTGPGARVVAVLEGGMEVLCDTETDGGGWIVIQRRASRDVSFYRSWLEYKYGFGDLEGNFWFGNQKISRLTNLRRYKLRVDFKQKDKTYFAEYDRFRLTGEDDKYRLRLGVFSGNGTDNFAHHNYFAFSTHDRDNDRSSNQNCAVKFGGGWWYGMCYFQSLNGAWRNSKYGEGLTLIGITFSEMKIRPVA